jgi:predicted nucleic acid-binding protein
MSRVVLDASAALRAVTGHPEGVAIRQTLRRYGEVLAPPLFAAEVGNAVWLMLRAGDIDLGRSIQLVDHALRLVSLTPAFTLNWIEAAVAASAQWSRPVYDMLYITLAIRDDADLLTADRRMTAVAEAMTLNVAGPHV